MHRKESLTAERASAIIAAVLPKFRDARVELLDEGWDFQVFEVGAGWLFRFPKCKISVAKLNMEYKLLAGLGRWVPLPVPSYEYFFESHESSTRTFAGYKKLPGTGADTSDVLDRQQVARQLGVFLSRLHSYPVDKARDAGVPEAGDLVSQWRDRSGEQMGSLNALDVDLDHLARYLENDTPATYQGTPSLVHNDLWAEHVIVDTCSGAVSGIIDWGDAMIGDPVIDFAYLYTWYGKSWLEDVLAHYTGEVDVEVVSRSRYLATCVAIHCITLGRDMGRVQWVEAGYAALQQSIR